jgi:hypothetical protein
MRKNTAKKTIMKIGMRKARSSDGMALVESPDVITKTYHAEKESGDQ